MKSSCERCGRPLQAGGAEGRACSYGCTFCESCTAELGGRCPNCGGQLLAPASRL